MLKHPNELFYGFEENTAYLDCAASTLAMKPVLETGLEFLSQYGSIHRGAGKNSEISTNAFEEAREIIREEIRCENSDTVIFTANTTDGINRYALMSELNKEDIVLVSDIEHSSNLLPWLKVATVKTIESSDEFKIEPESVRKAIQENPKTKIVALAASSNITGYIPNIREIYKICKEYDVIFFLDASQYAPHFRVEMNMADVIAYCGHKMYAPFGSGVLAGNKKLLSKAGLAPTGGGNVVYVSKEGVPFYKSAPFLHEAGTANGIGAVTLAKAHSTLYGMEDDLCAHNNELLSEMEASSGLLRERGYNVWFSKADVNKTPIMIIDCQKMSNKLVVEKINQNMENHIANVLVREGAFCAYRVVERLLGLSGKNPIQNGELASSYSLIRLSAGLPTTVESFRRAIKKLSAVV